MTFRHRLAAVWFADIVNYSALSASNEAQALGVVRACQRAARRTVDLYGGRVVKYLGDGVMAEFSSTQAAISSAHALQIAFDEETRGAGLPVGRLRIGVHSGEIVESEDGDIYGDGVNVAARIAQETGEGEIVVSQDVWRQLRQRPEFSFESLGSPDLKGIGIVEIFRAEVREALAPEVVEPEESRGRLRWYPWFRKHAAFAVFATSALAVGAILYYVSRDASRPTPVQAEPESPAPAVAVLPFQISGNAPAEWHEGMVDLLSTNLDGVAGLRAISGQTMLARWRETVRDRAAPDVGAALQVGRSTGARFAIVSHVVGVGSRVRLLAEVYDLDTGTRLGQSRVEGAADSVFVLVDRLTIELLGYLGVGATGDSSTVSLAAVTTDSLRALRAFLEAESRFRRSDWAGAFETYQRAVKIDSTFALAMFRLGQVAGWGALDSPVTYYERAIRHADRMRMRNRLVLQGALGRERGSSKAIHILEEATRLYPEDATAWLELGEAYYHLGAQALRDQRASDAAFERVVTIDPTFSPAYIHLIGNAFGLHGDSARAARLLDDFLDLAPATPEARLYPLGLRLAFGGAEARRRALADADSLPWPEARFVARNLLWHPRSLALQETIYAQHNMPLFLASALLRRGRLAAALEALEGPSSFAEWHAVTLYRAHAWGFPIDEQSLEAAIERAARDSVTAVLVFVRGAHAADRRRWQQHDAAVRSLGAIADTVRREGNTEAAEFAEGAALALRGYRDWREGRSEQGFNLLERARTRATGSFDRREDVNATIRRWLVLLARERRDPREVEYLESFWGPGELFRPVARLELARAYERAGDQAAARYAYEEFAVAWSDADVALRARIEGTSPRR